MASHLLPRQTRSRTTVPAPLPRGVLRPVPPEPPSAGLRDGLHRRQSGPIPTVDLTPTRPTWQQRRTLRATRPRPHGRGAAGDRRVDLSGVQFASHGRSFLVCETSLTVCAQTVTGAGRAMARTSNTTAVGGLLIVAPRGSAVGLLRRHFEQTLTRTSEGHRRPIMHLLCGWWMSCPKPVRPPARCVSR
jgi:hypothetical protein